MTPTQRRLASVLAQLECLNANVVKFDVKDLSPAEAEGWLKSESRRLEKLMGAMGDVNA